MHAIRTLMRHLTTAVLVLFIAVLCTYNGPIR